LNRGFTETASITMKMMELFSYANIQKASRPLVYCQYYYSTSISFEDVEDLRPLRRWTLEWLDPRMKVLEQKCL